MASKRGENKYRQHSQQDWVTGRSQMCCFLKASNLSPTAAHVVALTLAGPNQRFPGTLGGCPNSKFFPAAYRALLGRGVATTYCHLHLALVAPSSCFLAFLPCLDSLGSPACHLLLSRPQECLSSPHTSLSSPTAPCLSSSPSLFLL